MRKFAVLLFVLALITGIGFSIYESSNAQKKLVDEENYHEIDLYFGKVGNPNFRAAENKAATIWLPKLWVEDRPAYRYELPYTQEVDRSIYVQDQLDACYGVTSFLYEINSPEASAQDHIHKLTREQHFRKEEHMLGKIPLTLYCTGIATKENGMLPEEERFYFYSYEFEKDGYSIWTHFITKGSNNESAVAFQKKIMSTLELSESFKRTDQ